MAEIQKEISFKEPKKKKSIFKRWWFWVIAVIVIIIAENSGGNNDQPKQVNNTNNNGSTTNTPAPSTPPPAQTKPEEPKNKPTISKAEFEQIQNGMTYDEVVKIIGGSGELLSEAGEKGTQFFTQMYMFKGDGISGANANFTFQDGKLQGKAQFGLK